MSTWGGTPGVTLAYEDVQLTQAAEPADALTMLAGLRGYVPPQGTLVLEGTSGLLRTHGLVVAIHAPDEEAAIETARDLRPR